MLFTINYPYLDRITGNFLNEQKSVHITRVIDGDTIVAGNETIRLLGINTPERKDYLYNEANEFLNASVFNKTVYLDFGKRETDKYGRTLAYIFLDGKNINLELVEEGYANPYFLEGKDKYYGKFFQAWNKCIEKNQNLCEKSVDECSRCIILKKFDSRNEEIVFYNQCNFICEMTNWSIKDEGRKKFIFPKFFLESNTEIKIITADLKDNDKTFFWKNETNVWTETGDTLFLRDDKGKLVLWENY